MIKVLEKPALYTQRCVEKVSFRPSGGQNWTRSLQIRVPSFQGVTEAPDNWHVISLGTFARRRFPDFVVRDAHGCRLNLLTRQQHGDVLTEASLGIYLRIFRPGFSISALSETEKAAYDKLSEATRAMLTSAGDIPEQTTLEVIDQYIMFLEACEHDSPLTDDDISKSVDRFLEWCVTMIDTTRYLCWVEAAPDSLLNLEVSYTANDARSEVGLISPWWQTLPKLWKGDRETRMEVYRRYGLAPLNYAFPAPGNQGCSYYFQIDPPENTALTYLDWEVDNNLSDNEEVDSSLNSVHIYTNENDVPGPDKDNTIRAYMRPVTRAHKQIAAGALLNLIFVYLVAIGRAAPNIAESTQAWLLLTPAALMAVITEQQRHYYAAAIRRQRAVLWFYLGTCIVFLIAMLFGLPHAAKSSDHWGLAATIAAWVLASFSLWIFWLTLPLGIFYEWFTKHSVRREMEQLSGASIQASWWDSYERELLLYGKRIWRWASIVAIACVAILAITNWGRTLKAGHVLHIVPAALKQASHDHVLGLLSVTSWPAKGCTHCNLELRFIPVQGKSGK